jgi:hypothetical protein
VPSCFNKNFGNDKVASKKAFTDLDTLGNPAAGRGHCCVDCCAKEDNAGFIAATVFEDISFANKIN